MVATAVTSFELLAHELVPMLSRFAAMRVAPADVDDVVSEALLVAWQQQGRFDPNRGSQRAWALGICVNVIRRHHDQLGRWQRLVRRVSHAGARDFFQHDDHEVVDERIDVERDAVAVRAALQRLGARDQEILLLASEPGITTAELAVALDIPPGTVKSRLNRARARMQRSLATTTLSGELA